MVLLYLWKLLITKCERRHHPRIHSCFSPRKVVRCRDSEDRRIWLWPLLVDFGTESMSNNLLFCLIHRSDERMLNFSTTKHAIWAFLMHPVSRGYESWRSSMARTRGRFHSSLDIRAALRLPGPHEAVSHNTPPILLPDLPVAF